MTTAKQMLILSLSIQAVILMLAMLSQNANIALLAIFFSAILNLSMLLLVALKVN